MKLFQNISIAIFLTGIGVFVAILGLGRYKLTDEVLKNSVVDQIHYEQLLPELEYMIDKEYSSNILFIKDFMRSVKGLNKEYKKQDQWEKVIWKDYCLVITKNSTTGILVEKHGLWFFLSFIMALIGALLYIIIKYYKEGDSGKNNNIFFNPLSSRGWLGIVISLLLLGFYVLLYWYPEYISNWIFLLDSASKSLSGIPSSQWFFYGFLYLCAVIVMGLRMILKYRQNKYQRTRTYSVIFFQVFFAFLIPEILVSLNKPWIDLKNIWPLDYDFYYSWNLDQLLSSGSFGIFALVWGIVLSFIAVPILTYFFGKRWYCSWVCGCGGLAETLGDPFRHLSDKSLRAWRIERWLINLILLFAIIMTATTLINYFSEFQLLGGSTEFLHKWYGFLIGATFAGFLGTGLYPILGNRIWCRFGCPLAAYLGIVQRFKSRFRITTNGGQCISCGNCSTYCEMGIDVRWYAQRGQNIIRASCVGCGICSALCPRGVLKLESKSGNDRHAIKKIGNAVFD